MGYFRDAVKGVSWAMGLRLATRAMSFVKVIIVARLIGPAEFGIYGVAALVLALLEVLTETGINVFLVQEEEGIEEYINTAWLVSILRGLIISVFLFILSVPISTFFSSSEAKDILRLTAIIPLFRGFINPAVVSFQKDLRFDKEFFFWGFLYLIDTIVALYFAFTLRSAESIIYGMLAATVLEVVLSWLFIRPLPQLKFELTKLKLILNRGKWITLSGIFNYLFMQGDDIVVGRFLNTTSLGHYQLAYKIGTLPITELHSTVAKVTLPIYSKIRGDMDRLKVAFFKVIKVSGVLLSLYMIFILIFAGVIVEFLLGEEWLIIIPAVRVLSIFGIIRTFSGSTGTLFLAVKKQEYRTAFIFSGMLGIGISIIPLVNNFGILGASYSALIGALFEIPVVLYYLKKVFNNKLSL